MINTNYVILAEVITALGNPNPELINAINNAPRVQIEQKVNSVLDYYEKNKSGIQKMDTKTSS